MMTVFGGAPAPAEVKVIEAESVYIMGDNDSRIDARRIAVRVAKGKALELAGTYVESLTQVRSHRLAMDEIQAYTAGMLETEIVAEQMRGTTERPEVHIRVLCKIDTDVLLAQINRYRENEDLREQLEDTVKESAALKKERDALVRQLAAQKDKAGAEKTRKKLDAVLSKEESNDETNRIWAYLDIQFDQHNGTPRPMPPAELDRAIAALDRAIKAHPQNQRAQYLLASLYQQQGDLAAAEKVLRTAIKRHPSSPAPHMKLGIILRERGNYMEAMKQFHYVERMRPKSVKVVFYTGMTFKDMGKCGKAVQYLNRFLKNKQADSYPGKKELAAAAIEECGGDRPGRHKRPTQGQAK